MHREMTSLVRRRQRHVRGLVMSRKTQGATPSGRLHSGGGGCRVVWNRSWGGEAARWERGGCCVRRDDRRSVIHVVQRWPRVQFATRWLTYFARSGKGFKGERAKRSLSSGLTAQRGELRGDIWWESGQRDALNNEGTRRSMPLGSSNVTAVRR